MKNKNMGSTFDSWLREEGIEREVTANAIERVRSRQDILRSSGNVFADMGLPDAAELDTKARLGAALNHIMQKGQLTPAEIATALGIDRQEISALLDFRLEGFSVERLRHFLEAIDGRAQGR